MNNKTFSVHVNVYKYGNLYEEYDVIFSAADRKKAKQIAKTVTGSLLWALDLTPKPDLRTVKDITDKKPEEAQHEFLIEADELPKHS